MPAIKKLSEFTGHKGSLYSLIPFGNGFVSAGGDKMIVNWPNIFENEGKVLAMSSGPVFSMLMLCNQNLLLAANDSGGIHVIDLKTQKEIRLLKFHGAPVFDMISAAGEMLMLTASGDGTLALVDTGNFSIIKQLKLTDLKVRCLLFFNEEKLLAAGTGDGLVYIFEFPELKLCEKIHAHQPGFSVNAMAFFSEKQLLITGGRDAHLNIFNVTGNFEKVQSIPAHNYSIYSIAISPDRNVMATASRDKTIKIWDTENFRVICRISKPGFDAHTHSVNRLLWKGDMLISAGDDRKIILWEVK